MSLKEKVQFICNQYNGGRITNYAENMLFAIDEAEKGVTGYAITTHNVSMVQDFNSLITWDLRTLLGECILINNENFFE